MLAASGRSRSSNAHDVELRLKAVESREKPRNSRPAPRLQSQKPRGGTFSLHEKHGARRGLAERHLNRDVSGSGGALLLFWRERVFEQARGAVLAETGSVRVTAASHCVGQADTARISSRISSSTSSGSSTVSPTSSLQHRAEPLSKPMHGDFHGALGQIEAGGDGPIRRQLTGVGQVRQERVRLGGLTGQFAFHAQALERTVERDGRPFAIEYSLGCVFVAALECVRRAPHPRNRGRDVPVVLRAALRRRAHAR